MRTLLLTLALAGATAPVGINSLYAEAPTRDLTCEICRQKEKDGAPCKAKVTRGTTTPAGINYTCANGHSFTVEPKTRIR